MNEYKTADDIYDAVHTRIFREDFRTWLASHDREVAAKAWDEGYDVGAEDQVDYEAYQASVGSGFDAWTENPYKNGETL